MRGLFSVEGKFFTVTSKIADMAVLMLLWAAGCIPVVTIIPSTAALYHVTVKCIRYDRGKISEEFWDAYKKNLRQGIGLTLLYGGIGAAVGLADCRLLFQAHGSEDARLFMGAAMLLLTLLYLMNVVWLIPVSSRFANTLGKILQLNFVISLRNMARTIPMLLLVAGALLLFAISRPLILLLPSLFMLLLSYFAEAGMRRYMPEPEEGCDDWRYGFK